MKSLYNKSTHSFQEQQIPLPDQRDYVGNDKGYAEAYHAYAHQQPTRTIACRPGDVWEEGKLYEEGKDYFLTSPTDEDDLFTESFEVCAMAPLAPPAQEELWRDLIDTVTNGFDDENLTDKLTAKYQLSLKSEQPEAVGFAEWLKESNWGEKETWGRHDPPSFPTMEQLYKEYLKTK